MNQTFIKGNIGVPPWNGQRRLTIITPQANLHSTWICALRISPSNIKTRIY